MLKKFAAITDHTDLRNVHLAFKICRIYADGNIAVQGSYSCRGAFIYDISNPDAPVLARWYNPGNNQQFLEAIVVGNRGYFGSGNGGGVHIVDLTDPSSPVLSESLMQQTATDIIRFTK